MSGLLSKQRRTDLWLWTIAASALVFHLAFGNRYGFHRDELQFLDDARHLDWGYVPYPPLTAWLGRASIALFGISPLALRLPAMLIASLILLLSGWTARELGGRPFAQVLAATLMLGVELGTGQWLMYVITDALAWTLLVFCLAKVLAREDGRWWLGVGAAVGLGIESKYTIAFAVAGLLAGLLLLPSQWRHLSTRWFWLGAAAALLIAAPHLLWEWRHGLVTLKMLHFIHERDVRIGRANSYFYDQVKYTALGLPLALAGAIWLGRSARFRPLLFVYLGPFVLLAILKGRGYYLLPAYLPLYAGGAVWFADWTDRMRDSGRAALRAVAVAFTLADATVLVLTMCAVAPLGSRLLHWQLLHSSDVRDQFGWPEMAAAVARARDTLPAAERARAGVGVGNYGEAGALALYGPKYGLPYPISTVNTYYYRGYVRNSSGDGPQTLLTIGVPQRVRDRFFQSCVVGAQFIKPYSVGNDDEEGQPVYICRGPRLPWAAFWAVGQTFG